MVLSFSDEEEDIYQRMLQVVSNNKNLEWCNKVQEAGNIQLGGLRINLCDRCVIIGQQEIMLTNREFDILYLLAKSPGRIFGSVK